VTPFGTDAAAMAKSSATRSPSEKSGLVRNSTPRRASSRQRRMQRAVGGVRHAVLAAGGTARDVRDEALEAAVHFALRIPDRAEQLRQRFTSLGFLCMMSRLFGTKPMFFATASKFSSAPGCAMRPAAPGAAKGFSFCSMGSFRDEMFIQRATS